MPAGCYQLYGVGHAVAVGAGTHRYHGPAADLGQQQGLGLRVVVGWFAVAVTAGASIAGARNRSHVAKNWFQLTTPGLRVRAAR